MALNPFEQLRLVTVEPRTAFEEIVGILLLDHGRSDGQVKVHLGDAGIDAYKGRFGASGELTVYQSKYFPDPWQETQKRQIRDSFRTANESTLFELKEWFLCIPTRPTKDDLRWFDEWKDKQSLKQIDLVDGDDLTRLLEAPQGSRARRKLGQWGVFSIRDGYAVLEFSAQCITQHPRSGFTFRLDVWLKNKGDRTAEGLKVMAQHSDTNCVGIQSDRSQWDNPASAVQNPRTLWSKSDLLADTLGPTYAVPVLDKGGRLVSRQSAHRVSFVN